MDKEERRNLILEEIRKNLKTTDQQVAIAVCLEFYNLNDNLDRMAAALEQINLSVMEYTQMVRHRQ